MAISAEGSDWINVWVEGKKGVQNDTETFGLSNQMEDSATNQDWEYGRKNRLEDAEAIFVHASLHQTVTSILWICQVSFPNMSSVTE